MRHSVTGAILAGLQLALASPLVSAQVSQGTDYADPETRAIVEEMVAAHGGTEAWNRIEAFSFMFFTKNSGNPEPWLSRETVDPRSGRVYLDWPVLDALIVWDESTVWAVGWEVPLSPGFFTRLTYSFVTLPWQTQQPGVRLDATGTDRIPNDETEYLTVRMTYDRQTPSSPGNLPALHRPRFPPAAGGRVQHRASRASREPQPAAGPEPPRLRRASRS
jgi:hypothetical protein